jgi:hypothetical protein
LFSVRQALQSGEPVARPLSAAITMICDELNELVDLAKFCELETQTKEEKP